MKRKKLIVMLGVMTCFTTLSVGVFLGVGGGKSLFKKANADPQTYTATLNSSVFAASGLTETYQERVVQNLGEDKPVMNYYLAKKDASNNLVLAPAGKVFNYASSGTYKGRITDIISVTVSYSGGALYVQEGLAGQANVYGEKSALTSGVEFTLDQSPNYLMISNSSAETTITSLSVKYSCSEAPFEVGRLGNKYTGKAVEGNDIVLERNGSTVSALGYSGNISVGTTGEFEISLADGALVYAGTISADYKTLTFTGKSGAGAGSAPTLTTLNRVYVVDDFEDYTAVGTGFGSDQTSVFSMSDLRGAYYVDVNAGTGNKTWIDNSWFKFPSDENYLNMSESGTGPVHGGSKAMLLQGQKAGWVRAWNSCVWDQNQHYNFGSGNKLTFWIHSAMANADGTSATSDNVMFRVQAYYQNFVLTDSTRNSSTYGTGVSTDFTVKNNTGWNEISIDLDPSKSVYAVNIMINNSGLSSDVVYMAIDDITISTVPEPTKRYTETSTNFTRSYHGDVDLELLSTSYTFTVKVGIGANGAISAYAGADMDAQSYTIVGNQITIVTTGSYKGISFGTWVGTLSNSNNTITFNKLDISGDIANYITSSVITLNADTVLVDGSEANASAMDAKILRQYQSGSWIDDPGNGDRYAPNGDYYIQGTKSIKVRAYSSGNMRIIMEPTLAESVGTINCVSFWIFIPMNKTFSLQVFTYKDSTPVSDASRYNSVYGPTFDGSKPAEAGWHYISMGLKADEGYGKNFAIFVQTNATPTILDYITYF